MIIQIRIAGNLFLKSKIPLIGLLFVVFLLARCNQTSLKDKEGHLEIDSLNYISLPQITLQSALIYYYDTNYSDRSSGIELTILVNNLDRIKSYSICMKDEISNSSQFMLINSINQDTVYLKYDGNDPCKILDPEKSLLIKLELSSLLLSDTFDSLMVRFTNYISNYSLIYVNSENYRIKDSTTNNHEFLGSQYISKDKDFEIEMRKYIK